MSSVVRLLHEALPALRTQQGISQEELAYRSRDKRGQNGVSIESIRTYEKPSRAGAVPEVEILDALARGLGVDPAEAFYEYPIAAARRAARPGISQRRARVRPEDAIVETVEEAASSTIASLHNPSELLGALLTQVGQHEPLSCSVSDQCPSDTVRAHPFAVVDNQNRRLTVLHRRLRCAWPLHRLPHVPRWKTSPRGGCHERVRHVRTPDGWNRTGAERILAPGSLRREYRESRGAVIRRREAK